ncbi:N-methylhydantoinase B [hydrothermal vent metagenome]|uniref:N-methylhydantoinase B n=1 Tax=hydrothermal vent metagenome TaxID=652676 RepID=A0A3B1AXL7_9ZZZZ
MNVIELSLFSSRMTAVCSEMGAVLLGAAFSPNIRDRLDYSCAIFDLEGELCAQAAHIPVHLGSMAYAMRDIVAELDWHEGDMAIVNNPYLGGTHLPDVTVIAPVFYQQQLVAYVANRAHHADIGADTPGSMPISKSLSEEGIVISPCFIQRAGQIQQVIFQKILSATHNTAVTRGDFAAQMSANNAGVTRLLDLIDAMLDSGSSQHPISFDTALVELNQYAQRLAESALLQIPDGEYSFSDVMDDDGMGSSDIVIKVNIVVKQGKIAVDFSGSAKQVAGNINCPLSVAAAGVYYVFRCLMPDNTPACSGSFRNITLTAPKGCLLNAEYPAAVAAGNVETSTRVVDVVMGALAQAIPDKIPAASHGSMNNLAMGSRVSSDVPSNWDYYETIGGGMGGGPELRGLSGVQTHMTNTRNTPIEVLETHYPLRITQYAIRPDSGGRGAQMGGDGLIREYQFLAASNITLLTERRHHQPWGIQGGTNAKVGENLLNNQIISAKINIEVKEGDKLTIKTPGGGGFGKE